MSDQRFFWRLEDGIPVAMGVDWVEPGSGARVEAWPCDRCPDIEFHPVLPVGPPGGVYVVSEGPGHERPHLLDAALAASGLRHVRTGLVACCRATTPDGALRSPTAREARNCSTFVKSDIVNAEPKAVVLLGRVVAEAFFGDSLGWDRLPRRSFEAMRGAGYRWAGAPCLVDYHPKYVEARGGTRSPMWRDWVATFSRANSYL